mgnify:FL=1
MEDSSPGRTFCFIAALARVAKSAQVEEFVYCSHAAYARALVYVCGLIYRDVAKQ